MASYGSLCTEFYDLDKPVAPEGAVEYYIERARTVEGRILEPMCGSGRFLLPMLGAGVPIDGVDASRAMLDACRLRARREGLEPVLYEQPLKRLCLPFRYSMALIPSGSIGLIARDEDLRSALSRLHRHLVPGGQLLMELPIPGDDDFTDTSVEPRDVHAETGATITYACRVSRQEDPRSLVFVGTYEKRRDERLVAREMETIVLRQHRVEDILALLLGCGFGARSVTPITTLPWLDGSACVLVEARA